MYDKDMFQTVPFRLNLNHDEDALVWKLLLSIDEEPRKSLFGDRSKFIKWVLVKYARDEFDFEEAKKKLDAWDPFKKKKKAVSEVLKAVVAGGVSVGTPIVTTKAAQGNKAVSTEEAVPKMGVLPEADENNELPTSALSFLNGF